MAQRNIYDIIMENMKNNNVSNGTTGHRSYIGPVATASQKTNVNPATPLTGPVQGPVKNPLGVSSDRARSALGSVTGVTRTPYSGSSGAAQSVGSQVGSLASAAQRALAGSSNHTGGTTGSGQIERINATGATSGGGGAAGASTGARLAASSSSGLPDGTSLDGNYGSGGASTQFGQSFAPQSYEEIWSNPEIAITEWLNQAGVPLGTGSGAQTMGLADRIGIMWMLMNNEAFGSDGAGMDTADFIDWSDGYLGNMRTPGGSVGSTQDILGQITAPGEGTPLAQNLYGNGMSAGDQINSAMSTMRYGLQGITPALMLQSMLSRVQDLGRQYQADIATGRDVDGGYANFGEYLAMNGLGGR